MGIDIDVEKRNYMEILKEKFSLESKGNDIRKYYTFLLKNLDWAERTYLRGIYEEILSKSVADNDYQTIKNVFFQGTRTQLLPSGNGGYDHCWQLWGALDSIGCDNYENIYRLFPNGIPLSCNGYPTYVNATNILLCILYNKGEKQLYEQNKVTEKALKFIASKKPRWDRAVVAALLGILEHDIEMVSQNLQAICESTLRIDLIKYKKIQCITAYGITALAYHNLTKEEFQNIKLPEYKNYSIGYIKWFLDGNWKDDLCILYDHPFEEVNTILKMPVAISQTNPPFVLSDDEIKVKKVVSLNTDKMLDDYISNICEQADPQG